MQFYVYAFGFLGLGVLFSLYEYVSINYPVHPNDDNFDMAFLMYIGSAPFLLLLALVALAFMVSEILQPGITLSTIDRNALWFISSSFATIVSVVVMSYNSNHCIES